MTTVFIPPYILFNELVVTIRALEAAGHTIEGLKTGVEWETFIKEVPDGATVVVYSVDFFPSLMELLSTLAALQERGVVLKSLQEPWLSSEISSTAEFLVKLKELAVLLHQNRTRQGLDKARAEGKKLGRPVGYRKARR